MTGRVARRTGTVLAALAGALALCLWVESGIARTARMNVLLPFAGGQFLPGRMAREGAALVLCMALALTERGRALSARMENALEKDRTRWLISAVVAGLFLLWACRVTVVSFMTNDDTSILKAVGRIVRNGPSGVSTFSRPLFCVLLAQLYRLAPAGDWYAWYQLAIAALCCTVTGRCLYLKMRGGKLPVWIKLAVHMFLCAGLYLYPMAELSFTVTPALAGTAAVALILCRDDTASRPGRWASDVCSLLLMVLCCLQRWSTGQCLLCFWALAMVYRLLRSLLHKEPAHWKNALYTVLWAFATLAAVFAAASVSFPAADVSAEEQVPETGYDYATAEHFRSQVMDYLLDGLTDEQLEAVGLPPELSTLLRGWFFMDRRINTDTFIAITAMYGGAAAPQTPAESSGAADESGHPPSVLAQTADKLAAATADEPGYRRSVMAYTAVGLALLLALVLLRLLSRGKDGWLETLCGLCAAGGACVLSLYLIWAGRFPLRVFLVTSIPAAVTMLLTAPDGQPAGSVPEGRRRLTSALSRALTTGLCALSLLVVGAVPYTGSAATRQEVFADQLAAEDWANAEPDTVFITNFLAQDIDPFHDPLAYPANLSRWGGTGITASADRRYADSFFEENVRFMYYQTSTVIPVLQYLTLDFGPVQALSTTKLTQNISVADLDRVSPGADYTGWYEQNGMTYYFRDGVALTGEQIIDGDAYTFAPAGAQAQLVIAPGPAGIIYTTDAYSLVTPEA